jgi:hypothetical protein
MVTLNARRTSTGVSRPPGRGRGQLQEESGAGITRNVGGSLAEHQLARITRPGARPRMSLVSWAWRNHAHLPGDRQQAVAGKGCALHRRMLILQWARLRLFLPRVSGGAAVIATPPVRRFRCPSAISRWKWNFAAPAARGD